MAGRMVRDPIATFRQRSTLRTHDTVIAGLPGSHASQAVVDTDVASIMQAFTEHIRAPMYS
ncbi:hypothetical protein JYU34_003993 [Plutella xylostella]|uniref:Uncharacterized protein n=1 Tax=Plutella xylostella TaxID=51655 RepID=A0ABQ7QWW6_PLUXY|nr:hypothetical protein JYU34_003993 [Plutella xylostella]